MSTNSNVIILLRYWDPGRGQQNAVQVTSDSSYKTLLSKLIKFYKPVDSIAPKFFIDSQCILYVFLWLDFSQKYQQNWLIILKSWTWFLKKGEKENKFKNDNLENPWESNIEFYYTNDQFPCIHFPYFTNISHICVVDYIHTSAFENAFLVNTVRAHDSKWLSLHCAFK